MRYFLSADCGLTNVKAAVISETGDFISYSSVKTPQSGDFIDTEALFKALCSALSKPVCKAKNYEISRICISGHGNGLYYLKSDGTCGGISPMNSLQCNPLDSFDITLQSVWSGQPFGILHSLRENNRALYLVRR
jgi:hypothetical protein